jgi:hypothetical protein
MLDLMNPDLQHWLGALSVAISPYEYGTGTYVRDSTGGGREGFRGYVNVNGPVRWPTIGPSSKVRLVSTRALSGSLEVLPEGSLSSTLGFGH